MTKRTKKKTKRERGRETEREKRRRRGERNWRKSRREKMRSQTSPSGRRRSLWQHLLEGEEWGWACPRWRSPGVGQCSSARKINHLIKHQGFCQDFQYMLE